MNSFTEENYLKAIYKLLENGSKKVSTKDISLLLTTSPASVTDMLKKLALKKLIHYERYRGVSLTPAGKKAAIGILRRHRLWELFLVEKLHFRWDQVHDIAEQLEHIQSDHLIERLDRILNYPKSDPHGDPIPNGKGIMQQQKSIPLSELKTDCKAVVTGVIDHSPSFLQHIEKIGLSLGKELVIRDKFEFDQSLQLIIKPGKSSVQISNDVAKNLLVIQKK